MENEFIQVIHDMSIFPFSLLFDAGKDMKGRKYIPPSSPEGTNEKETEWKKQNDMNWKKNWTSKYSW